MVESEDESDDEDKAISCKKDCKHEGKQSINFNRLRCKFKADGTIMFA